jgi:hypothetical protein
MIVSKEFLFSIAVSIEALPVDSPGAVHTVNETAQSHSTAGNSSVQNQNSTATTKNETMYLAPRILMEDTLLLLNGTAPSWALNGTIHTLSNTVRVITGSGNGSALTVNGTVRTISNSVFSASGTVQGMNGTAPWTLNGTGHTTTDATASLSGSGRGGMVTLNGSLHAISGTGHSVTVLPRATGSPAGDSQPLVANSTFHSVNTRAHMGGAHALNRTTGMHARTRSLRC